MAMELEHVIGYAGDCVDSMFVHPGDPNQVIYCVGKVVVISDSTNPHDQEFLRGHDQNISKVCLSQSGNFIGSGQFSQASKGSPAPVVVWNLKERQAVYVLSGLTDQVTALGFTPDDAFVVGTDIKGKMCVWNMKTGQCDITTVSKNPCSCLSTWQPSGKKKHPSYKIVTCHASQVAVHDLTFEVSKLGYVSQVSDCQLPSSGFAREFKVCRLYTEDSLWCLAGTSAGDFSVFMISEGVGTGGVFRASVPIGNGALTAICFSGEDIYTGGGDGKVSKLSGGDLQWIKQGEITLPGGTERIRNGVVAMSETPDGTGFVIGTSLGKIFKVSSDFRNVTLLSDSHTAPVTAVAFGAAPNLFATVSQDCSLRVWNLDDYSNIAAAKGPGAGTCCAFIEETVITGWADGSIMANEFDTGTNVWKIPNAHKEGVTALHANPDFIASGGGDKTVRLWGAQTPQNIGQFGGQSRAISGVIVDNQKDNWVHMCSLDKTASTIDLAKEERVKSYQNGEVYTCITQRSSGEREMIVGSASGKLTIWDPDLDKPVGEAQDPSGQCVTCISCSPSGNFAATCGKDGQVKIWDCSVEGELTLVGEPGQGHSSSVCGVAWSPDEKQLVSVGEDCCICVWNFYGA